jgi:hypothetical protein
MKTNLSTFKKLKFIVITFVVLTFVVMLISELFLYIMKYSTISERMKDFSMVQAKWWTCDSVNGPRYVADQADKNDSLELAGELWYYKRLKIVNNEGYHDRDNFSDLPKNNDSLRVLFAGDSFTWGASADLDSSYVEIFDRDINQKKRTVIWNTGIPATGTNHAIFTVKKFLPLQKSDVVILGFFTGNDFSDNLLPFDRLVFNEKASCYNLYGLDRKLEPFQIPENEAYKLATGSYPENSISKWQKFLNTTRIYSFFSDMKGKIVDNLSGKRSDEKAMEYQRTKDYLSTLKEYVQDNNAELVVLVIPSRVDIKGATNHYTNAIQILQELKISYLDPLSLFSEKDYFVKGGGHWNNAGHAKAGHFLSKYICSKLKLK